MSKKFKVGDHVRRNSEAGHVSGHITKIYTSNSTYKGYTRHCSEDESQYEIKSDRTDHVAMHKRNALEHAKSGRMIGIDRGRFALNVWRHFSARLHWFPMTAGRSGDRIRIEEFCLR